MTEHESQTQEKIAGAWCGFNFRRRGAGDLPQAATKVDIENATGATA
jgi:hypothetical protein